MPRSESALPPYSTYGPPLACQDTPVKKGVGVKRVGVKGVGGEWWQRKNTRERPEKRREKGREKIQRLTQQPGRAREAPARPFSVLGRTIAYVLLRLTVHCTLLYTAVH
jgi:hypothetical protein